MSDDLKSVARAWAALPQVSDLRACADGAWAFWCGSGPGEVADVFAAPLAAPGRVEQLTFGTDHFQIRDVSADGQVLILAQARHASGHDHLLLLDRRVGNRLRLLTPKQDSHRLSGGSLTRDGKAVLFVTNFDYPGQVPVEQGLIWRQDLTTGQRQCLARIPQFFSAPPRQSPSGQRILLSLSARAAGSGQIWVMNADGTGLREVFAMGETNDSRGEWLDEDRIVVVTDRMGRDEVGIFTLSAGTTQWLGGEPQVLPHKVVVGGKGGFACIAHKQGQTRALLFDAAGARPLPNLSGRRTLLPHAGLPDGGWLAEAYDADAPAEVVQVAPNGLCRRLTVLASSQRRHRAPRDFGWVSQDGRPVQGWLYEPEAKSRGLIVHVHDGPASPAQASPVEIWHAEDRVNPDVGFWVQLGYTVLVPNSRGSTGFGYAWHAAARLEGWREREQDDLRTGIEAAIQRGYAPSRIAVTGTGSGGSSSWCALLYSSDLVTVAIPICASYRADPDHGPSAALRPRTLSEEKGASQQTDTLGKVKLPSARISQIRGHVLMIDGSAPSGAGAENPDLSLQQLTAAGIPPEVMVFDNEGHGILRRTNVETRLMRAALFVERAFAEGRR